MIIRHFESKRNRFVWHHRHSTTWTGNARCIGIGRDVTSLFYASFTSKCPETTMQHTYILILFVLKLYNIFMIDFTS